jgi:hypothetical protein
MLQLRLLDRGPSWMSSRGFRLSSFAKRRTCHPVGDPQTAKPFLKRAHSLGGVNLKIPARVPIRDPGIKLSHKPENGHFFVTTITLAEILYGIELIPKGKRRDKLLAEAEAMFAEDFAGRLLPFAEDAVRAFRKPPPAAAGKGVPPALLRACHWLAVGACPQRSIT